MPTVIYAQDTERRRIASLGEDEWLLVDLIPALEAWLRENRSSLKPGRYVADVGYEPREGATGGGPVLSAEMMRTMADIGMALYLSEYNSPDPNA